MGFKCFLKGHNWVKVGGPINCGGGSFKQRLRCVRCGKIKYHIS